MVQALGLQEGAGLSFRKSLPQTRKPTTEIPGENVLLFIIVVVFLIGGGVWSE